MWKYQERSKSGVKGKQRVDPIPKLFVSIHSDPGLKTLELPFNNGKPNSN